MDTTRGSTHRDAPPSGRGTPAAMPVRPAEAAGDTRAVRSSLLRGSGTMHTLAQVFQSSLPAKLFVSYLLVIVVGAVTVFVVTNLVAPAFFADHMTQMMQGQSMNGGMSGGGMGGMGGAGGSGTTVTTTSLNDAFRLALMRGLLIATAVAMVGALLVSLFVARQLALPIQRMAAAARRIGAGQYAQRVAVPPVNAGDEIGQLATSFNAMAASLEQGERRRLELVGDVAHELRTPIATLEGYLEGLLDGVIEPGEETWARLHDEAGRLRRLVDDLQQLSRAEAHQIPLHPQRLAPAHVVEVAVERVRVLFEEKGLTLQVAVAPTVPTIWADQDRAVQVVTNVLTNALRYTPAPGRVSVRVEPEGSAGQFVAMRVTDTGIGLSPDQLSHLFERFYRVDKSRSRALGGSGIGLTIARALAEAMGGRLTAASPGLGRGSTFTFSVPVAH